MSIDWIPTGSVRPIPAKNMGNRGIFPSNKVPSGVVEYESCLERDFFLACDHAVDVMKFQHQPVCIEYKDGKGKSRKYTPDVFVEFINGKRGLYEIKYEEEVSLKGTKYEERWKEARKWAQDRGMDFAVLTEQIIRTPRWFNIWFTLGSSKCTSNNQYIPDLLALIPKAGAKYNDLCKELAGTLAIEITKAAQVLCYAIYHGLVVVDSFSTKHISGESVIRGKHQNSQAPFRALWDELREGPFARDKNATSPTGIKDTGENPENITPPDSLSFKIPLKYEAQVHARLRVVKAWMKHPRKKRTDQWRREFFKTWHVCEKTVYNWVGAYENAGIEGLIPRHQKAGRPTQFGDNAIALMEQARQYFLTPLVTRNNAYAKLEELCKNLGTPAPKPSTFKQYIYHHTTASEFARKRGIMFLKAHFTSSLASFQGACVPMQVVQMDNTRFDVFPVDSENREGLPTPYMTAAIDCYTRMLAGFSVSYYPSSAQSVLEVLVQSILPKQKYVDAYDTQQEWAIQGFPVLLLVDNGMDYRSQSLKDFCIQHDVIVEYAPIRTPRFKAFIEQWFNVLHNALVKEDVSGTRPSLKERLQNPDLKPEAGAILTLQEIERWLYKWILDEYHFTNPYGDRAPAPYLRWQDFQSGGTGVILPSPREPPADRHEVDLLFLATLAKTSRMLGPDGVAWEHLKYNSKELAQVFSNTGRAMVEVLVNRRDVRCVWVVHPITASPIKVGLASGWAQAIAMLHGDMPVDASAWATEVSLLRERFGRRISPYDYQKEMSRNQRQELLREAKTNTKSARKAREKAVESAQKEALGEPREMRVPTSDVTSAGEVISKPKEIDWTRIKPAGRRERGTF